ncbi:MAG: DUF6398 domain-containing protein [Chloroflexota bacterium]|nr:DUF6398 domain-containing protein [Chloroflexota bacterium]
MAKRSTSEQVPKDMQARFDEITQLTNDFSKTHLTDEYAALLRQLTAALCRKRPSPLSQGKVPTWACAIIHAVGAVNFLFDSSQTPHVPARQIASSFDLSVSTMQARSKQIRDLFDMYQMDPKWTLPSMIDQNPLVWMIQVNGLIIDAHHAPREIQEEAFYKGLIPYIPGR